MPIRWPPEFRRRVLTYDLERSSDGQNRRWWSSTAKSEVTRSWRHTGFQRTHEVSTQRPRQDSNLRHPV